MKTFTVRLAAALLLSSIAVSANAGTFIGTFLDNTNWSLVHDSATPGNNGAGDFLRWDPGQTLIFELTGTTLTAAGPQEFMLESDNGATATFTLMSATLDLSGANGFGGGTMDYMLDVSGGPLDGSYSGTFTFLEQTYGNSPFNSSILEAGKLDLFLWGGDAVNDIGIDIGLNAQVPIPAPLLLFASSLIALGLRRRSRR